jgi:hypothetical protein
MAEGPIRLLHEKCKVRVCIGTVGPPRLVPDLYHLLVQRLFLRLVAREALGTRDGLALGKLERER